MIAWVLGWLAVCLLWTQSHPVCLPHLPRTFLDRVQEGETEGRLETPESHWWLPVGGLSLLFEFCTPLRLHSALLICLLPLVCRPRARERDRDRRELNRERERGERERERERERASERVRVAGVLGLLHGWLVDCLSGWPGGGLAGGLTPRCMVFLAASLVLACPLTCFPAWLAGCLFACCPSHSTRCPLACLPPNILSKASDKEPG
jgi:hypothetical protein